MHPCAPFSAVVLSGLLDHADTLSFLLSSGPHVFHWACAPSLKLTSVPAMDRMLVFTPKVRVEVLTSNVVVFGGGGRRRSPGLDEVGELTALGYGHLWSDPRWQLLCFCRTNICKTNEWDILGVSEVSLSVGYFLWLYLWRTRRLWQSSILLPQFYCPTACIKWENRRVRNVEFRWERTWGQTTN